MPAADYQTIAVMINSGRVAQARTQLARLLAKTPGDRNANVLMRHTLRRLGEHRQALYYAERALAQAPDDADLLSITGQSLADCGQIANAEATLRRALEHRPDHPLSLLALANIVGLAARFVETLDLCERALKGMPGEPTALGLYTSALVHLGRADDAVLTLKRAMLGQPGNLALLSLLCGSLNYATSTTGEDLIAAHRLFGRSLEQQFGPPGPAPSRPKDAERHLRIGAISADFRRHAIMCFFEPFVDRFDRARFDLFLYHNAGTEDDVSARIKAAPGVTWRTVAGQPAAQTAQRIRDDQIDILLDLSGHTGGGSPMVMHMKPAPVQACWVGYQCTTGLRAIDYRLVDSDTDPPGFEALSTETLWRMDPCHFCYRPPLPVSELPDPGPPPMTRAGSDGRPTLACFANMPKLNDRVVRVWARVLQRVPGAVLLLKNRGLTQESSRAAMVERFRAAGVNPDRLRIEGPTDGPRQTIAEYARVDVALDTFPFQGMTTICEAVLMGVPPITLAGATSGGRQGVPIMRAVGLESLVCDDEDAYVNAAAALLDDPARLTSLRASLRARLLASPICDEVAWVRRLEVALRQMWRAHVAGPADSGTRG